MKALFGRMTNVVVVSEKGKAPRYVTRKEADRINLRRLEDAYDAQVGGIGYEILGLMAVVALTVAVPVAAPMILIQGLSVLGRTMVAFEAKAAYEQAKAGYEGGVK